MLVLEGRTGPTEGIVFDDLIRIMVASLSYAALMVACNSLCIMLIKIMLIESLAESNVTAIECMIRSTVQYT